ncbi:MAG: beta family protein [Thermoanaerobaculia bacterium]
MTLAFGPNHYLPVLKVKRGEKKALTLLPAELRTRITPVLEIVERKADKTATIEAHLDTAFKDLAASVSGYGRCLLDAREISADGPSAAEQVFRRASDDGIVFTPITGLSRTVDVAAALAHQSSGIALRLTREEFEGGRLTQKLQSFLSKHALTPEGTDLVVDLGPVDDMIADGVSKLRAAFLADVPDHVRWRTLTVSASSFPMSMSVVGRNSHGLAERSEWRTWQESLFQNRSELERLPTFSDCAIQHPKGVEGFDPKTMPVSASIRYALSRDWLLIKGESTRLNPPGEQFPILATRLVYGHLRDSFLGAGHCEGCRLMKAAADHAPKLGSPEAWRRLGTIHHMSLVMDALGSLPWP